MNKAIAFIIVVPITAFIIYELIIRPDNHSTSQLTLAEISPEATLTIEKPQPKLTVNPPVSIATQSTVVTKNNDEFDAINRPSDSAKQILKAAGVLPNDLTNEAYVEFDLPALKQLKKGDSFDLAIPQTAETFSAEVTNVIAANNGDTSIFGRVIGAEGRFHTTVMTVGLDAVYGQFTAPSGNYVFESKGKYGWLAAKRDLYRNHKEHQVTKQPSDYPDNDTDLFAPKSQNNGS